jgi:HK97 family phage portal protein
MLRSLRKRQSDVLNRTVAEDLLGLYSGRRLAVSGVGATNYGDRTALALPAYWRAVNIKADLVSTLPLGVQINGRFVDATPPIIEQPDPTEDRQTTLIRMVVSSVQRGEILALLGGFDDEGFPQVLKVIDPLDALLNADGTWSVGTKTYDASEVLHVPLFILPGERRGIGVLELHRRYIEGELLAQDYQAAFYRDGAQPSILVKVTDSKMSPADIEEYKRWWMSKLSGRREPIVHPGTMDVTPLALSNRDAQFLESRVNSLNDVANMVGVPSYYIGGTSGGSMTYSNVTEQRRDLLDVHLRGLIYSIERAFSGLIPAGVTSKFNPASFLRLDPKATAETLNLQKDWMTLDEIRQVQSLDPLPNGEGQVIASHYTPPTNDEPGGARALSAAETLQKIYLAVGNVVSAEEAREIVNANGGNLTGPPPPPPSTGVDPSSGAVTP